MSGSGGPTAGTWTKKKLKEWLPIRYGKARSTAHGFVRESTPVYGSSGLIARYDRALTSGPTLIVGRKGNVGSAHYSPEPCWPIDTVFYAEASPDRDLRLFAYLLEFLQLSSLDRSTAVPGLSRNDYNEIEVALPAGVEQQRRIVEEIEKQLTRLEAGVAALKRVRAHLKRYRAAVLAAACEGRLVPPEAELARQEGRPYEPASVLLTPIMTERTKTLPAARRGKQRRDAAAGLSPDPASLPEGWAWAAVGDLGDVTSGNTPKGISDLVSPQGDYPWFKVGAMNLAGNERELRVSNEWLSQGAAAALAMRLIPAGAIVFPKRGGAIATNKKRMMGLDGCCDLNLMAIVPDPVVRDYLWCWFAGVDLAEMSDGSNVPQINHKDVAPLLVPVPPLAEQRRIVAEVERLLSLAEDVDRAVAANLDRASHLRQSILAAAFDGRLSARLEPAVDEELPMVAEPSSRYQSDVSDRGSDPATSGPGDDAGSTKTRAHCASAAVSSEEGE